MTPDEWLLNQFDLRAVRRANHVRPMFQVLDDVSESSTEAAPFWSGPACWPEPLGGNDLDRRDKYPAELPARTVVTFAPAVI